MAIRAAHPANSLQGVSNGVASRHASDSFVWVRDWGMVSVCVRIGAASRAGSALVTTSC